MKIKIKSNETGIVFSNILNTLLVLQEGPKDGIYILTISEESKISNDFIMSSLRGNGFEAEEIKD